MNSSMGQRIKLLRESRDMTAQDLAQKIGVSKSTVSRWENGAIESMSADTVMKVSDLLEVSPVYLITGAKEKTSDSIREIESERKKEGDFKNLAKSVAEYGFSTHRIPSLQIEKSLSIDNVINQLIELRKTLKSLSDDENKLVDAFRHMSTSTQKKFLAMLDQWRDF